MSKKIPLSEPSFCGNEKKYLKDCIDSGWVSSAGSYVDRFEESIARYTGVKNAISIVNGTSAIHLALKIAGVKPGHEVIAPTLTFIAPINAISYLGAKPVFMDSDPFFNIDIEKTIDFLNSKVKYKNGKNINKDTGNIVQAILPVHIFGTPIDLAELVNICTDRNIKIVEDASESLGSFVTPQKIHSGTMGDMGCISFNGNKIITCGGGGMILTNSDDYAKQAQYLSTQAKDAMPYYHHTEIGYNYRMSNVIAAIGVGQMEVIEDRIKRTREINKTYRKELGKYFYSFQEESPTDRSNMWLTCAILNGENKPEDLISHLEKDNIEARRLWKPMHEQPVLNKYLKYINGNSSLLFLQGICLPSGSNMTDADLKRVIKSIKNFFNK